MPSISKWWLNSRSALGKRLRAVAICVAVCIVAPELNAVGASERTGPDRADTGPEINGPLQKLDDLTASQEVDFFERVVLAPKDARTYSMLAQRLMFVSKNFVTINEDRSRFGRFKVADACSKLGLPMIGALGARLRIVEDPTEAELAVLAMIRIFEGIEDDPSEAGDLGRSMTVAYLTHVSDLAKGPERVRLVAAIEAAKKIQVERLPVPLEAGSPKTGDPKAKGE